MQNPDQNMFDSFEHRSIVIVDASWVKNFRIA